MKISPKLAALVAAAVTAPVTAVAAASVSALADQAFAWVVTALVTALVSALAGAVTKLTGAKLDQSARDALQVALTNAANVGVRWMIASAAETPWGRRVDDAVDRMLRYVPKGAPDAIARFYLDASPEARAHLRAMAEAHLIEKLRVLAPDQLRDALNAAGAPVVTGMPVVDAHGNLRR